ncbi:MAG: HAD family hydrolase [Chloroflexota bacterium]|nr:HAD family hydrolase [Chloroflexota bacterium]
MAIPVRGVLFDLDNTLVDRDPVFLAYAAWFARERLGLREEAEHRVAVDLLVTLDAGGYGLKPAMFAAIQARYPVLAGEIDALVVEFRQQLLCHITGIDAATAHLLDKLDRHNLPWGIVTNGSSNQLAKIRALTLEHRARAIVVSEVVGVRKPEREVFLLAAAQLAIAPAATLFVGDNPLADIQGAHQAGMQTAWLRRGRLWPPDLANCAPTYSIDSLSELCPHLFDPLSA